MRPGRARAVRAAAEAPGLGRRSAAELVGTFVLVFAGTGAIVVDAQHGGALTHVGVSLTFGLVVLALIQAFGDVSGAHLNPAVTWAFVAARRFALRDAAAYTLAQLAGAVAASAAVAGLLADTWPDPTGLGLTRPSGSAAQAFVLEVLLTWALMLVILAVSSGAQERGLLAGVAIGSVVAFEALLGGPVSGASMNPARSLGPALVAGELAQAWIYVLAPLAGALLAVPTCRLTCAPACCAAGDSCR